MALINCPECGNEISDKAVSCPHCGNPMNQPAPKEEEYILCPKCHSKEIHSEQSGFSGGKALAGAVIAGGMGLLAGTIGSKDVQITCLRCGKKFKAGKALILSDEKEAEINKELVHILKNEGKQAAFTYYKNKTGADMEAIEYVNYYSRTNNIVSKKGGCAPALLFFILFGSLLYMMC